MAVHPWHDLAPGARPPDALNVVVEIPRGSRNKYEIDKESGLFRLDRLLYSAVHYPGDYGFIPRTLAQDGDPLDVVVLVTVPTFTGCLIEIRPLGVFVMSDEKGIDEKILAVAVRDPLYEQYRSIKNVQPHFLLEMEHFFAIYKDLEGKTTNVTGWRGLDEARRIVLDAVERYQNTVSREDAKEPG